MVAWVTITVARTCVYFRFLSSRQQSDGVWWDSYCEWTFVDMSRLQVGTTPTSTSITAYRTSDAGNDVCLTVTFASVCLRTGCGGSISLSDGLPPSVYATSCRHGRYVGL